MYDSTVPEGTGESLYMTGTAEKLNEDKDGVVSKFRFMPKELWINDEAKNEDGSYKHDIRVKLDIEALKEVLLK